MLLEVVGVSLLAYFVYSRTAGAKSSPEHAFRDKVVWITGASSGIGEALAYAFHKCGAKLILSARNSDSLMRVRDACVALNGQNPRPEILLIDLERIEEFPGKVEKAVSLFGQLHFMVHNAGRSVRGMAQDTLLNVDRQLMEVNYFAPVALTKLVLPVMQRQKFGHFVVVSSVQGMLAIPHRSAYSASKHALNGFFDSLKAEVYDSNIHVTIVTPGYVKTNLSVNAVNADGSSYGKMDEATAKGYEPSHVADCVVNGVAAQKSEVFVCDATARAGIFLRVLWPWFLFKMLVKRARKDMPLKKQD